MVNVRKIKVSHGELTVQLDSFPARWEIFQGRPESGWATFHEAGL